MAEANNSTLEKISRVMDLVAEMNLLVRELRGVNVDVFIGGRSVDDPLGQTPVVHISIKCEGKPLHT